MVTAADPFGWGAPDAPASVLGRAADVQLILTDCDGCLTDGGVYVSGEGEEMKRFHVIDGLGIGRLREAGIEVGIVTGEFSRSVRERARKLGLTEVHLGIREKGPLLEDLRARRGLAREAVAYFGDDCNDLPVLPLVALFGCPGDAFYEVRAQAHWQSPRPGGRGAFRDFAELILRARGAQRAASRAKTERA